MSKDRYSYVAVFSYEEDGISIEFPDLPGCLPCAEKDNTEEALKNAKEALGLHIWGMEQDGEEIPVPTPITSIHLARCEPRLREQCFGKYEGTPRDGAEFRISKTHFADRYDGGESMMQLAQRIYNLLDELRQDKNKTYLLVAHNGIARVVESYFHDMTNEEYSAAGIKNCELVEYRFE